MALNSLGQISMGGSTSGQSIALELGLPATSSISLGTAAVYKLAGKSSASNVDMGSFRGKRNSVNEATLSSNRINLNIYNEAVAVGWDKSSPFVYTIAAGSIIYSNDTTAACTTGGAFPGGLTIYNGGTIVGRGGTGGSGGQVLAVGGAGTSGSTAITITTNCTIVNNGTIGGGGGGGGGGNGGSSTYAAGGGGGGGAGYGSGGSSISGGAQNLGNAGSAGGATAGGTGGTSVYSAGTGGAGGGLGASGITAGSAWVSYFTLRIYVNGGAGGGAGIAISKNGYTVTTSGTGTTYGAVG